MLKNVVVENRKRSNDNSIGIFTQALMWFMDGALPEEKLGIAKLVLCNLHCDCDSSDSVKQAVDPMIDTIKLLIEHIRENKKTT